MEEKIIAVLIRHKIPFYFNGHATLVLKTHNLEAAPLKELLEVGVEKITTEVNPDGRVDIALRYTTDKKL